MFRILLLFIIIVPALEIALLLLSGRTLGLIPTVLLIISTGVLGAWLARREGSEAIQKVNRQMQTGQMPGDAILDGLCILIGGVVLLTPGFITDAVGFLLLIPATRKPFKRWMLTFIERKMKNGQFMFIRR
ncbi:FxsA family protein [Pseudalkalibacillus hwajinpoensis]|uniref:Membrane protein FxsA n=1 Tax=Guptibacillus hwajinpoensis TaxID=208199 RepID=A0A4U1MAR6_9BACL|nr:FxsA family protein [Pseudalkalibacillus hwajinpoensis]TKD67907.1 membrane protein FxsA [Pseudalkalibacillus hwajinpoensis]